MTEELSLLANFAGVDLPIILAAIIWTLIWKGFALWRAAELKQKWWFIAILILNTLGILEVIYLFVVARGYKVEIVEEKQ
jgi:hypothetical protein